MLRKYLYIFLISMIPLIELRGAIPAAQAFHELDNSFSMPMAYVISVVGNMLPVPVIFFFARKVLEWGADKPVIGGFFRFCLEKGNKGGEKLKSKAGRGLWAFRSPEPARGPAHWPRRSWIWISRRVRLLSWEAFFLPASSWRPSVSWWPAESEQSAAEKQTEPADVLQERTET